MGWEIVRENFPNEPNKWSRLWDPHDIERALTTYEGIKGVETINLDLSKLKTVQFNSNVFSKMTRLRLLKVHSNVDLDLDFFYDSEELEEGYSEMYKLEEMLFNRNFVTVRLDKDYHDYEVAIPCMVGYDFVMETASKMRLGLHFEIPSYELRYLCWDSYPLDSLPSNFDGKNLVELHLKYSNIKQLWQGNKYLESLKVIDLSYSEKLVQMPEFSSLSNLERLILKGCVSLIDFHPSIGGLKKLTTLNLKGCLKIKGLPSSISNLESLEFLDLSKCSSFCKFSEIHGNMRCLQEPYLKETATKDLPTKKFPVIQRNMRSLRSLYLCKTAIRELPSSIDLESVEILDLSNCFKFEKFSENGAKMKSLRQLDLTNTAIKELPTGIANWESLPTLDLSKCSKFEKFPEIQGNMRSLKMLLLNNTAIKGLPDSIGYLESLKILNVSDCSKFEKFPEKGGNMKNLESLWFLDLSNCSKFEKFPEKGGNMKSLRKLCLKNTAIKDLPDSIGDLESLEFLDLSDCSKFEKFPEKGGNMKSLKKLSLKNTAIKDLPDSIGDLESLWFLDLSDCSKFEKFPEKGGNMKSLMELRLKILLLRVFPPTFLGLLWLCHLNWLKSTTEELKCWKLSARIPESSGIPEWIRYQNLGSEVTAKLPINWYEDPDFPGFVVSCVYRHIRTSDDPATYYYNPDLVCELNLHGNGFRFKDECSYTCWCECNRNSKHLVDQVWVWWYPKIAIPKQHHHKSTHINASVDFRDLNSTLHSFLGTGTTASFKSKGINKKCGINLIFAEINKIILPCWSILGTLVTMDQHYKIRMVMFMGLIKMMNTTIFPR
ncbi:hypothetical protein AAG906_011631 [Vitis piasezkii]